VQAVSDVTAKPVAQAMHIGDLDPPHRSRATLLVFMVSLIALVYWASVGKIDQVTRAQGQVIAAERTQIIQSPDGGVLTVLHVKEQLERLLFLGAQVGRDRTVYESGRRSV
jgi:adhesin transport system membrane fusion protein